MATSTTATETWNTIFTHCDNGHMVKAILNAPSQQTRLGYWKSPASARLPVFIQKADEGYLVGRIVFTKESILTKATSGDFPLFSRPLIIGVR